MLNLFILDGHHAIGKFYDKETGYCSWQMIITKAPTVNNEIDLGKGFELVEINPNCFEWNGEKVCIKEEHNIIINEYKGDNNVN